jgi:threonyl-tRNA synthetase
MPQRFDVRFVDARGDRRHVVMLHRALYGSIERFVGLLLEHHGAALPAWLAPEQIAILPISADHAAYAEAVHAQLALHDVRSRIDREGTVARRVAVAQHDGVPFVVVVGDREVRDGTVAVRARDGQSTAPLAEGIANLVVRCTQ